MIITYDVELLIKSVTSHTGHLFEIVTFRLHIMYRVFTLPSDEWLVMSKTMSRSSSVIFGICTRSSKNNGA